MASDLQAEMSEKQTTINILSDPGLTAHETNDPPHTYDNERDGASSTPPRLPAWRRFLGIFWDTFSCDAQERKHLLKLDTYMLSYMCLAYCKSQFIPPFKTTNLPLNHVPPVIKQIDQTNISNAFISGMREDLHLYANERNWLNTTFNIGILLGTFPAQLLQAHYIRPSLFIPLCEIFWSLLVLSMAFAPTIQTLYALRFFIGFAEACVFPGFAALLGGWYGPMQLAKRAAVFEQSSAVGNMFSGYLQAGLYEGMDGVGGLRGWQWMFVVDGLMGLPVAVWGMWAVPDLPHTTRAFYWSEEVSVDFRDLFVFERRADSGLGEGVWCSED